MTKHSLGYLLSERARAQKQTDPIEQTEPAQEAPKVTTEQQSTEQTKPTELNSVGGAVMDDERLHPIDTPPEDVVWDKVAWGGAGTMGDPTEHLTQSSVIVACDTTVVEDGPPKYVSTPNGPIDGVWTKPQLDSVVSSIIDEPDEQPQDHISDKLNVGTEVINPPNYPPL